MAKCSFRAVVRVVRHVECFQSRDDFEVAENIYFILTFEVLEKMLCMYLQVTPSQICRFWRRSSDCERAIEDLKSKPENEKVPKLEQ